MSFIRAEYFKDECNKAIFNLLNDYYKANKKIDPSLIISSCSDRDIQARIMQAAEIVKVKSTFDEHLSLLKSAYKNRKLQNNLETLLFDYDSSSYADTISQMQRIIEETQQEDTTEANHYIEEMDNFLFNLTKPHQTIKTGLSKVDKVTGGLRKGTVFMIGARPSTGKTALALNIAEHSLKNNKKVVIFSLEMSAEMIFERIAAAVLSISYDKFLNKSFSVQELLDIEELINKLKKSGNLYVIDDINAVELITEKVAQIKPDLVIVDFIQIVTTLNRQESQRVKIDYISAEFKRIAKRTKASVIILSQLKRNDKNEPPTMSDLKESGGLEQDGDYIALLHRPYVADKRHGDSATAFLNIDKNKFGTTGFTELHFNGEYQRFTQVYNKI